MKSLKKEKGITLIALVVTIIVLLILAGVSITMLTGDDDIVTKATEAAQKTEEADDKEKADLEKMSEKIDKAVNEEYDESEIPEAGTVVTKPSEWTTLNGTAIADGNGGTIPLPAGFYYVDGDIKTGLVISSKEDDTLTSSGTTSGNQFVWIPVTNYSDTSNEALKTKIETYGGFYFSRYEAGVNSTEFRTGTTSVQTPVSKNGVVPYNFVTWEDAVSASENMYDSSTSVESSLCYGEQWDEMCAYIEDSSRTGETQSTAVTTGSVSSDVSKNICDLTTNAGEWTMEEGSSFFGGTVHIIRGGWWFGTMAYSIDFKGNTDDEYGYADPYTSEMVGFRVAMYVI